MIKLVIQAGHNPPDDPGAVHGDIVEAVENLKAETRVHTALRALAAQHDDLPPIEIRAFRGTIAEKAKQIYAYWPLCAVELHHNAASSPEARGYEVLYALTSGSKELARDIDWHLARVLPGRGRGIKVGWYRQEPSRGLIGLFRRARVATVIPEPLFITSPDDAAMLYDETRMTDIAQAIATGIMDFVIRRFATHYE